MYVLCTLLCVLWVAGGAPPGDAGVQRLPALSLRSLVDRRKGAPHLARPPGNDNGNDYEIVRYIDQGRYSMVFEAIQQPSTDSVVIKVLKNSLPAKSNEVSILRLLRDVPNIVSLKHASSGGRFDHLVFSGNGGKHQPLCHGAHTPLTPAEVKKYFHDLLTALSSCHERSIIHRDVKPKNIAIVRHSGTLRLLDFGLSDYYAHGKKLSVSVGSRHFKAPELLLGYPWYNSSVDIWSAGCIFAALIFGDEPFFSGVYDEDNLASIASVLGSEEILSWASNVSLPLTGSLRRVVGRRMPTPFSEFVTSKFADHATPLALDLLSKILVADPRKRLTAKSCLLHPYFAEEPEPET